MLRERDYGQFTEEMRVISFEGGKGGEEEPYTPYETPNNLLSVAYAKVLVAVAEGTLDGLPTGKDIYLNGTPLLNESGEENFGGVTWEWRNGSVDQSYIQGMPEVSNEISVGIEVKQETPWVTQITKTSLSAARVTLQWPALMQQMDNGDTVGYTIDYAVDISLDGGPFKLYQQYQVSGKTNSAYERTHRVNLPKAQTGWALRVRRITANSQSSLVQDTMNLKSFAEVIDAKQRYPNTALLFVQFDSRLFGGGSIPKISVKTRGRVIRVPSNYDPASRTYTGVWAGDFKWAYTNNPAWIFYDIVTQDRFGLGNRVTTNQVDKWELYEVAQYCDVMVDDGTGAGTKEPRHTYNAYIQSKADAWVVLRDICNTFNGMAYWDGNQFVARADKEEPIDNIPLFSRANVENGEFNYATSDDRTIFTSALISYDDPTDHYNSQVEAVWEKSEIMRWQGDRQTELAAIGCTSRGQAQRKGKYVLLTNMLNRSVAFTTGLQGYDDRVYPGKIIGIADPLISGRPFTGRLASSTSTVVTLDRDTEAKAGDVLFITLKDGQTQGRTVKAVSGKVITTTVAYIEVPPADAVWYLEASDMKSQLFRVNKVSAAGDGKFEISATQYNESKYTAVDTGARLETRPVSKVPPSLQKIPKPITITSNTFIEQTMAVTTMTIAYPQTENAVLYEGQWRVGQGDWVDLGTTGALEFNVRGIFTGKYLARVRAINAMGIKSLWGLSETTDLNGKEGAPPALASLTVTPLVYGMRMKWAFPKGAEDTARTEIMYSKTTAFTDAVKLGDFAYPQDTHDINGLAAGTTFYFWARLVDRTGNVGPYFPLPSAIGVVGKSSTDFAEYEEYFKDQINESALGKDLATKIDKIEVIEAEVNDIQIDVAGLHKDVAAVEGSVNWLESQLAGIENQVQNDISIVNKNLNDAIEQTNNDIGDLKDDVSDLNVTVGELENQVANFVDALVYDPSKAYAKGDTVREGQKLYQALQSVPVGISPPNSVYWKDVGDIVTDMGALSAQVQTNSVTITQQGNTLVAQGQQLNALDTRVAANEAGVAGNTSAIQNLQTTVTQQGNTITSQGQAITALKSDVTSLQTGQAGNASAIESLRTTVTQQGDKITAQGQQLTSLGVEVSALQTDVSGVKSDVLAQGTAISGLTTTVTQQGDTIQSHSNSITSLEGRVTKLTTDVGGLTTKVDATSTAVTNLTATVTQQGNTITSQGRDITTLKADVTAVTTDVNGLKTTVTGQGTAISNLETKVTQQGNDISAISSDVTKLTSDLHFNMLDSIYDKAETDQQIGDALNIAEGAASATESLTSEVTKQGEVINAQAQRLTELTASLEGIDVEGLGSAVESLKTQVTSQGNTITSQGQRITQLNNSLTLVDGKADKAQADASNALQQVTTKADASAVTALTTRVTNAEGKITSQGQLITQLENSLTITNGKVDDALQQITTKADSSALQALSNTVTQQDGKITAQGQLITNLTASLKATDDKVDLKADASTVQALTNTVTQQGKDIAANTSSLTSLKTEVSFKELDELYQGAETEQQIAEAFNIANGAASATQQLTSSVTSLEGVITAQGESITELKASLEGIDVEGVAEAVQNLKTQVTSQGNTITSQGQAITQLNNSLAVTNNNVALKADTSALNSLSTKVESIDGKVTAQGNSITQLTSRVTNTETGVTANATAISQTNTKVTEIDGKLTTVSTRVDGVYAQVNPRLAGDSTKMAGDNTVLVGVWSEQSARIENDVAIGQRVDNVQVSVGESNALIQQTSKAVVDLDGKASAMWSVKLQVNSQGQYVAAGVGLGIENGPAGLQSTFLVNADKFAVVNGVNETLSTPFVVQGGQVFMKDAFIQNGSINMLKIGDNLQSDDYIAGVSGWRLSKGGNIEFNGTVAGGGKLTMSNQVVQVFDTNGILRVRLGIW